jgi:hypothetical protein
MAWTLDGHRLIAMHDLAVLPPAMREALAPHISMLLAGVVEPDFNRVVSHKIQIISLRGMPPPPRSGAADVFKRFATNAEEMLRLGRGLDGFMLVKNYSCFGHEIAQNSSQHARALSFCREIKRVTEIAWDQAVNDTANLWQSIFWHALGPSGRDSCTGFRRR